MARKTDGKSAKRAAAGEASADGGGSREAILQAALKAFACAGYDGASMPGIGRMAGVAPTLIHYYFGSKEQLWRETVEHSLGQLRSESSAICQATSALAPLDRLRVLIQAICNFAARCPDHFFMIIAEARAGSDRFEWVQQNYTGVLFDEVVTMLRAAQTSGAIRAVKAEDVAMSLVAGILLNFTVYPSRLPPEQRAGAAAAYCDQMFDVLLRGIANT